MPYVATSRLEEMIQPDACGLAAREMAHDIGDAFQANVKRNTPIDTNPYRDRPDRPRGFLRASIERTPVRKVTTPAGPAYRGSVFTEDDVAPHVEWDTRPHIIRAKRPGGRLHWRDRRTGEDVFAFEVRHPGTSGQHMFSIGAAITEHELEATCAPALARWKRAVQKTSIRIVDRRLR